MKAVSVRLEPNVEEPRRQNRAGLFSGAFSSISLYKHGLLFKHTVIGIYHLLRVYEFAQADGNHIATHV